MSDDQPKDGLETPVMSYSRMNSILTCGEQFRLQRKLKVPEKQHWASIGGSAFHTVVEGLLREDYKKMQSGSTKGEGEVA